MFHNTLWSTKVGAKLLSDLDIFLMFSYKIPLVFYKLILAVPRKYLMYFLAGINNKWFWNIPNEKYLTLLRIQIYSSNILLILLLILFNVFW